MARRKLQPVPTVDHSGDYDRQSIRGELAVLRQDVDRAIAQAKADLEQIREAGDR